MIDTSRMADRIAQYIWRTSGGGKSYKATYTRIHRIIKEEMEKAIKERKPMTDNDVE